MPLQPFQSQNLDLTTKEGGYQFQAQIASFLNGLLSQLQNGQLLAQNINGKPGVQAALGVVTGAQSVNCKNATLVTASLTQSGAPTLTLSNLTVGAPVVIRVAASATAIFKVAATDPSGVAYTVQCIESTGAVINMTTTGITLTISNSYMFIGNSVQEAGGPTLYLGLI